MCPGPSQSTTLTQVRNGEISDQRARTGIFNEMGDGCLPSEVLAPSVKCQGKSVKNHFTALHALSKVRVQVIGMGKGRDLLRISSQGTVV